jgi:hypothetical protein
VGMQKNTCHCRFTDKMLTNKLIVCFCPAVFSGRYSCHLVLLGLIDVLKLLYGMFSLAFGWAVWRPAALVVWGPRNHRSRVQILVVSRFLWWITLAHKSWPFILYYQYNLYMYDLCMFIRNLVSITQVLKDT